MVQALRPCRCHDERWTSCGASTTWRRGGNCAPSGSQAGEIDGWRRRLLLEDVCRAVYRQPHAKVPAEQPALAAVLRAGTGARISGELALALLAVESCSFEAEPEIIVPPERQVRGVSFAVRRVDVARGDRATVRGIPALRVERAVLEFARTASPERVVRTIDSARWLRLLRMDRLMRRAADLGAHDGARLVVTLHREGVLAQESDGERTLHAGLGPLACHFEWGVADVVRPYRLDAYDRAARLALEYDSEAHHTLQRDIHADRARELDLRAAGVEVIRVTKEMLRPSAVQRTRARIAAVREARLTLLAAERLHRRGRDDVGEVVDRPAVHDLQRAVQPQLRQARGR